MSAGKTIGKTVLCYGDSNTWGYVPAGNGRRHSHETRWPGVLSAELGDGWQVIAEGLNGRTTVNDDPLAPHGVDRNGAATFLTILESHKPLHAVVIFLGTNDLKPRFGMQPADIASGVEILAGLALRPVFGPCGERPSRALLVCPPPILEVEENFGPAFRGGQAKSLELRKFFRQMSARAGLPVLYAEDFVSSDPADGIHLSCESHAALGRESARMLREMEL